MKINKFFLPLLVVLGTFLFSCESEENIIQENDIESTNTSDLILSGDQLEFDIETNERFRYNLDLAEGDEVSIVSEASNAAISRVNARGVFIHIPEEGFTGTDSVLLRIESEPTEEQEGLILIIGNVRYVSITLNVGEEATEITTGTELPITGGACGALVFQDKIGDDYESAEAALIEIRSSLLTSRCPGNPCFESYYIENVAITADFDGDDRQFLGVRYITVLADGTETSLGAMTDVLDSEGNYYSISQCLD